MPIPIKCRENKSAWNKVKAQGDNMPIVSLRGEVAEEKGGTINQKGTHKTELS